MDSFSVVGERDSIFPFPFMSCLFLFSLFLLSLRDQDQNMEQDKKPDQVSNKKPHLLY